LSWRRLAGAAVLALAASACTAPSSGSHRLTVEGPRWLLRGFDARLEVTLSPALATYDAHLVVAVDGKIVARAATSAGRARVEIPAASLAVGPHLVSVKTGSERRELMVEVVPRAYAAVPAGIVLAVIVAAIARRRRVRLSG
jgi:hypothetical protein